MLRISYRQYLTPFEYGDEFLAKVDISSFDEHYLDYFDRKGIVARCSVSDLRPVHSSQFGQLSELRLNFASSVSEYLDFDTVITMLLR